jgi:glutaminyl-peptide cyclotransferase
MTTGPKNDPTGSHRTPVDPRLRRAPAWLWAVLAGTFVGLIVFAAAMALERPPRTTAPGAAMPEVPEIDAKRAYAYLLKVCRIGPRVSGTRGMAEQQKLIADHFTKLGAGVGYQTFDVAHPLTGMPVRMSNIVVSWHPEAEERVLICCHYDTRPFPDMDPVNPRGEFIGANDGGSGVALLMELGHHMAEIEPAYGVDFVFFDGEELVYLDRSGTRGVPNRYNGYFLGSEHFAKEYLASPPGHRYVAGVLLDMVADRNLGFFQEKNSLKHAPQVVESVWAAAARLGIREFVARPKHEILDDHIPLNEIAGIPTCDIIDFDYPHWHTMQDLPVRCSGASLEKVGHVVLHWLESYP